MIVSFEDKETEMLWLSGKSRRLPPDICRRALRKLQMLNATVDIEELKVPSGNRLKQLDHNLKGFWSLRINDQWRLVFCFEKGDAKNVAIVDYH